MATITLSVPDAAMPRVIDALCARGGYDVLPDPKPTRGAFAKSVVVDFVMSVTRNYEAERDAHIAQVAARTKADSDITIT